MRKGGKRGRQECIRGVSEGGKRKGVLTEVPRQGVGKRGGDQKPMDETSSLKEPLKTAAKS